MATQSDPPSGSAGTGTPAATGSPATGESPPLTKDIIFELLKNQRRRYVLRYLADDPGPVRLRDLAERIAAWENDKPIGAIDSDERKRVYVGLYQSHLTKMDEAGVVAFNQDRGLVALGERASVLYDFLDPQAGTNGGAWSLGYIALAVVSGVLTLLVDAGLFVIALSQIAVTGLIVTAFFCFAVVHATTASMLEADGPGAVLSAVSGALANARP
jgi:hypothetical protein